jgi:hypothetical protein
LFLLWPSMACGVLLGLTSSCKPTGISVQDSAEFEGTTNIIFTGRQSVATPSEYEEQETHLTVSAPEEIARLVSSIRLRSKKPCECAHLDEAISHITSVVLPLSHRHVPAVWRATWQLRAI